MEYLGKLEDKMGLVKSNSVRMVFADLPFNTTKAKWDTPIDLDIFWRECWRVLMDNGVVIAKAQPPFNITLGHSQLRYFKYEWIWEKTSATGGLNSKKMPMKASENLMVFYKKLPLYNPQMTKGHKRKVSTAKHKRNSVKTEIYNDHGLTSYDSTERFPRNVLKFKSDKQRLALHSTQTPEALIEYFIKTYTNEGDTILDPCRGVNGVGVCADRLKREAILIEKDLKFYNMGLLRRKFPFMKTKEIKQKYMEVYGEKY